MAMEMPARFADPGDFAGGGGTGVQNTHPTHRNTLSDPDEVLGVFEEDGVFYVMLEGGIKPGHYACPACRNDGPHTVQKKSARKLKAMGFLCPIFWCLCCLVPFYGLIDGSQPQVQTCRRCKQETVFLARQQWAKKKGIKLDVGDVYDPSTMDGGYAVHGGFEE